MGVIRQTNLGKLSMGVARNHLLAAHLVQSLTPIINSAHITHRRFEGNFCINVDRAVSFHRRVSAVGIIARDQANFYVHCQNARLSFLSLLITELHAILYGLQLILDKSWTHVVIKSDSKLAIDICNSRHAWNGHH